MYKQLLQIVTDVVKAEPYYKQHAGDDTAVLAHGVPTLGFCRVYWNSSYLNLSLLDQKTSLLLTLETLTSMLYVQGDGVFPTFAREIHSKDNYAQDALNMLTTNRSTLIARMTPDNGLPQRICTQLLRLFVALVCVAYPPDNSFPNPQSQDAHRNAPLTFLFAKHPRMGTDSLASMLPKEICDDIVKLACSPLKPLVESVLEPTQAITVGQVLDRIADIATSCGQHCAFQP